MEQCRKFTCASWTDHLTGVEEEFGKENQNGRIIIFDIKYEFHSEVGHNQKQ